MAARSIDFEVLCVCVCVCVCVCLWGKPYFDLMKFFSIFFIVVCAAAWVVSEAAQAAAAVNVVSGVSASEEYCLSAGGQCSP